MGETSPIARCGYSAAESPSAIRGVARTLRPYWASHSTTPLLSCLSVWRMALCVGRAAGYMSQPENMIDAYASDVAAGRIPAGKYHRLACQRHLRDRAREASADFPFRFDA